MAFHPYLFFSGTCRDAFTRYQEIFGGELVLITGADIPLEEQMPGADPSLIMHAALMTGDTLLMASDDPTGDGAGAKGIQVNFATPEVSDATRVFEALADGGEITGPIGPTSWSPMFGMCVDRFGIPWMVSAEAPQA